jgi:23S rRNA pseudouridine2605 synthase
VPAGIRLQRVLARAGIGSRRVCDEMVEAGRVSVNGRTAIPGTRVDPATDRIELDGIPVPARPDLATYLVNKPRGVVTTASDPEGRPTVIDMLPSEPRVFPVGRLDLDTEGLLVVTNDGDLAQLLAHPRHGVEKVYLAQVEGRPARDALRRLREGVDLDDGRTAPARVEVVGSTAATTAIELTIHDAVGHPVLRLVRTRIGPIADPGLRPGTWRALEPAEVRALYAAAAPDARSPRGEEQGPG